MELEGVCLVLSGVGYNFPNYVLVTCFVFGHTLFSVRPNPFSPKIMLVQYQLLNSARSKMFRYIYGCWDTICLREGNRRRPGLYFHPPHKNLCRQDVHYDFFNRRNVPMHAASVYLAGMYTSTVTTDFCSKLNTDWRRYEYLLLLY